MLIVKCLQGPFQARETGRRPLDEEGAPYDPGDEVIVDGQPPDISLPHWRQVEEGLCGR
jgi:hypothetical protein